MSTRERLVRDYVDALRREARDLPARRRDELAGEIEQHLADALQADAGEAAVRTELERLGDPADIVAEERGRSPANRTRAGALEYLAILLLLIGGVVVPVFGWLIGAVLLWLSRIWSVRDKLVGTLLLPGGLFGAVAIFFVSGSTETCVSAVVPVGAEPAEPPVVTCTGGASTAERTAWIAVFVVLVLVPILTSVYLGRALRRAERTA